MMSPLHEHQWQTIVFLRHSGGHIDINKIYIIILRSIKIACKIDLKLPIFAYFLHPVNLGFFFGSG